MGSKYDRAITIFSPDGKLFQIDYAFEAVKKGAATVGVTGKSCVALGVERKAVAKLQEARTIRKVVKLDDQITLAFAGLTAAPGADARVLVQKARIEAQSYRLTCEDAPSVEYMARFLARTQQRYTQRGGVRPFGVSSLLAGFESASGGPVMYQIDPSGTYFRWSANAIGGRNAKSMREYLEKEWKGDLADDDCVELCVKTLLEVVDSGAKNMEVVVLKIAEDGTRSETTLPDEALDAMCARIEREREEGKDEGKDEMKD
ncbi:unnamed protein product [Pelagomonas calceolata]|uniref:Proteasome subunit alpha type n=1 Tax=Pelagomonas calceolata TaxID=35677 RepID=A0A8J2WPP2_9STRA|nr:unnamed protein product [Pelagomonas calceolata]